MPRHSTPQITCVCKTCGETFSVGERSFNTIPGRGTYCSRECRYQTRERPCEYCGTTFRYPIYREESARFCSRPCRDMAMVGGNAARWKGGRRVQSNGYVMVLTAPKTWQLEHRVIMEAHLGRPLRDDEVVHHVIPGKAGKSDNRIENLAVMDATEHARMHSSQPHNTGWSHAHPACVICGGTDSKHRSRGRCDRCYQRIRYRLRHPE